MDYPCKIERFDRRDGSLQATMTLRQAVAILAPRLEIDSVDVADMLESGQQLATAGYIYCVKGLIKK